MALSKTRERLKVVREARVRARVKLEREEHELCVKAVAAAERTAAEAQAALDDAVNALAEAEAELQHYRRSERDALVRLVRAMIEQRGWSIAELGKRADIKRALAHRAVTAGASRPVLVKLLQTVERGGEW